MVDKGAQSWVSGMVVVPKMIENKTQKETNSYMMKH